VLIKGIFMDLAELYQKGREILSQKPYGELLAGVETEFDMIHDRRVLDHYTFRMRCIDAAEARTSCHVLGVDLATPVVMSAVTSPISAIHENGFIEVALGLKKAGSLMWLGSQIPKNLKEIIETRVPVAANVRPFKDRKKIYQSIETLQEAGVKWIGVQIDTGFGTKIRDRMNVKDCVPLSFRELEEIRRRVNVPLILKGVLNHVDAVKSLDAGADAIVVSHGAHILDYLPHPLQVMDEIVSIVGNKMVIIVDCNFRRGSDVLKGLAFGARLVGLCRPILYGLAAAGRAGVARIVNGITDELKRIMGMVGAFQPDAISREVLISD
jgi:isopentenyl diphosphate isomerase/L-lactate dehydrogenase-like FMN-dependent dehydrogenase